MATHPADSRREALCAWLTANGIDIKAVPLESTFAIVDEPDGQRLIHYIEYVLTEDGSKQIDPAVCDMAWKRPASAPCAVEPPAWLDIAGGRS